jgi:multidrug efflux pump subunit AcrB
MKNVFDFFLDNYKFTFVLLLMTVFLGLFGLRNLQKESRPPVDFATAVVTTVYPGSSPEEVEEKITTKIENEIRGVEGVRDVTSVSQSGLSTITIRVDLDNIDTDSVMSELQRAVQRVSDLPKDIKDEPRFTRMNVKEIPVVEMGILGSNDNRKRDKLAYKLKTVLENVTGVAEVVLAGYREREFQVLLNRSQMEKHHVGISEVVNAVRRRTQNIPSGYTKSDTERFLVRVTGQVKTAEEMGEIVIRTNDSFNSVKIKDVARVVDGEEDPSVKVLVNGEAATLLRITKKANSDGLETTNRLLDKISAFEEKLPPNFSVFIYNNEGERISDRLRIVVGNALGGLLLVLVILVVFLPGRLGFFTALSLPIALLGTIGLMPIFGATFNNLTMLGMIISIGMLVDNSIVISENYGRLRLEGLSSRAAALRGVNQFWLPLLITVLTTIAAFLPMLVTKGIMGQFIRWVPILVVLALSMSLFESFFLLPSRLQFAIPDLTRFEKRAQIGQSKTWFDGLRDRFERFMSIALKYRYFVFAIMTVVLSGSVLLAVFGNRFELFPKEEVEYYYARFELPKQTAIERTEDYARRLSETVREVVGRDKVRYVIARAGVQRLGIRDPEEKNGEYVGMLTINVPREIAAKTNAERVLQDLRAIDKGEAVRLTFQSRAMGPPVGKPLKVNFKSNNYTQLRAITDEFIKKISEIEGVVDLTDDEIKGGMEYRVLPDFEKLSFVQSDVQSAGTSLRTALQGTIASELNQDGIEFDLRVRFAEDYVGDLESLKKVELLNRRDNLIPITKIAEIKETEGPAVRKHYNYLRSIAVTAEVEPEKITSVVLNLKARNYLKSIREKFPDVEWKFGGEDESTKESVQSLFQAMILALFGIFALLVFMFNSFIYPFLVISCIPLGLIGVNTAFFVHGRPLSFIALIGVVGLAGVVVNSAIVLVSYVNDIRKEKNLGLAESLAKGSAHRLRAVLVTSLTTVAGLFPTAYGLGGYDSLLVPMTLALAWGLLSGTLLTIIWVPCGYLVLNDIVELVKKGIRFRQSAG